LISYLLLLSDRTIISGTFLYSKQKVLGYPSIKYLSQWKRDCSLTFRGDDELGEANVVGVTRTHDSY